jgi:hypothetical protein
VKGGKGQALQASIYASEKLGANGNACYLLLLAYS